MCCVRGLRCWHTRSVNSSMDSIPPMNILTCQGSRFWNKIHSTPPSKYAFGWSEIEKSEAIATFSQIFLPFSPTCIVESRSFAESDLFAPKTLPYPKISKHNSTPNPNIGVFWSILVPTTVSSLGSSQWKFQYRYQIFRFHLIWNRNGTKLHKMRKLQDIQLGFWLQTVIILELGSERILPDIWKELLWMRPPLHGMSLNNPQGFHSARISPEG